MNNLMNLKEDKLEQLRDQVNLNKSSANFSRENNSQRYRDSWEYYLSRKPLPLKGRPDLAYVEPVLYEAVGMMTPSLLNIFTENDSQAVAFRPKGFNPDNLVAAAVNNTINRIFLRENDGFRVLEDSFKEAQITGDVFVKYFIEETTDHDSFTLDDWTPLTQIVEMMGEWEFSYLPDYLTEGRKGKKKGLEWKVVKIPASVNQDPVTGDIVEAKADMMYLKGKIKVQRTEKAVKVEQVDADNLYVDDTYGSDFKKCRYLGHRIIMTRSEAVEMGYDMDKLMDATVVTGMGGGR